VRPSHAPLRLATGAFILNSGLGKRGLDGESAASLQGMAVGAIPPLGKVSAHTFATGLSAGETALGVALLAPASGWPRTKTTNAVARITPG